jgi:hypothetical protein
MEWRIYVINSLKEIICPDVVLALDTSHQEYDTLPLKENSKDSKLNKLLIERIPKNSFAFTLDCNSKGAHFKQLSCYLNKTTAGINKGCDLVIFFMNNGKYCVLIFDLKSDKPNTKDTKIQLMNSRIYVRYLIGIIANHYHIDCNSVRIISRAGVTRPKYMIPKCKTFRHPINENNTDEEFKFVRIDQIIGREGKISLDKIIGFV